MSARIANIMYDGRRVAQTFRQTLWTMEYRPTAIRKGRGFVHACDNRLYRQVKKHGEVRHLKCFRTVCGINS